MTKTVSRPWLEHYPEEIPASIDYEKRPLQDYLRQGAKEEPDKVLLHFMGKEMTFKEVYTEALSFANALSNLGIQKGDRVAIMLANTPQSVISYYGALFAGAVVVQTNPLYVERELEHQMVDSGAKIMICMDLVYHRVMNVIDKTNLEHVIVTGIKDYLPFPKNLVYPFIQKKNYGFKPDVKYGKTVHSFTKLLKQHDSKEIAVEIDPEEDLALLQYTGGTTGVAKGVKLTHMNLVSNTTQCIRWMYKIDHGNEVLLCALPFFHVYGMTVGMNFSVMDRSKMVILPKFDTKQTLEAIEKQKASIFPGAPTMYIGLINDPDVGKYDLSSIEICISGSAPLPLEVQQRFEKLTGGKLSEGFGLTESSPVTHFNLMWGKRPSGSIGLPWPDTDVAILSAETGEPAEAGEVGELMIKGPQVMKGYWNRPEETNATFHEGWLLTGDMGYMDEEGFFYIVDRKKDMIIAGGFNIYPREIEEVLFEHPAVQEAVAVGVPDPYRGETVKVFIVKREGHDVSEKDLNAFCRERLSAYKVPKLYEFREELPKTMVGKVLRRALLEEEKEKAKQNA
ncbi:AMP-binding protein [Salisediminibacterium selenitireducens]|uniref:AMP-dependent synthetase and ligase n=1 Tax=Bacillus selenitireducens (strain ATCC 700615 / DSM 15326 / MLS10) TaxID=439292 RepID=D6XSW8_BACIE|nr:AMP-binding protein [Salisediminibacterium selenitireducens]ADH98904.1 AMP-dependent synthetase and ligase [[Bacillus] selenitireducens MLS10]